MALRTAVCLLLCTLTSAADCGSGGCTDEASLLQVSQTIKRHSDRGEDSEEVDNDSVEDSEEESEDSTNSYACWPDCAPKCPSVCGAFGGWTPQQGAQPKYQTIVSPKQFSGAPQVVNVAPPAPASVIPQPATVTSNGQPVVYATAPATVPGAPATETAPSIVPAPMVVATAPATVPGAAPPAAPCAEETPPSMWHPEHQSCTPMCKWECAKSECEQTCNPVCKAPKCQTRCSGYNITRCHMECDTPHCAVICPKKGCPNNDCPLCTTQCSEPCCKMQCDPGHQPCENVCEQPECDWHCEAPKDCPPPQCSMTCEAPTGCKGSVHQTIPPLNPGQCAVTSFEPQPQAPEPTAEVSFGSGDCPCIGIDNLVGHVAGDVDGKIVSYPADLGAHCDAWDLHTTPGCPGAPWCAQKWCYVDPCRCKGLAELPKPSDYLQGAKYQGHGVFYSYATCGSKDQYTAADSQANRQAVITKACSAPVADAKWGQKSCRCTGKAPLLGEIQVDIKGKKHMYPAQYGHYCATWDEQLDAKCKSANPPSYCAKKWCYVSAEHCSEKTEKSAYLGDATASDGKGIHYSYATCGSAHEAASSFSLAQLKKSSSLLEIGQIGTFNGRKSVQVPLEFMEVGATTPSVVPFNIPVAPLNPEAFKHQGDQKK